MKVLKPKEEFASADDVTALTNFMVGRDDTDFDDVRKGIAGWGEKTDGEIQQACQDAGFETDKG